MNKLKLAVWILVLANAVIAYAGLNLGQVFRHIFDGAITGGVDALPELSKNYIRHGQWFAAVFTVPLLIAALIVSARRAITAEDTLIFGAITLLNVTLQIFIAATALSQPFIPVIMKGGWSNQSSVRFSEHWFIKPRPSGLTFAEERNLLKNLPHHLL